MQSFSFVEIRQKNEYLMQVSLKTIVRMPLTTPETDGVQSGSSTTKLLDSLD